MLCVRQLIPAVTLRTPDGGTVHAWDFKQRKNLVIAFLDSDCDPCSSLAAELAKRAGDLRAREAVALLPFPDEASVRAIGKASQQNASQDVVAGVDVSGSKNAFLGDGSARERGVQHGVFVTDRYGELSAVWTSQSKPQSTHGLPSVDEIILALDHIQIACEECYMPHWPVEG